MRDRDRLVFWSGPHRNGVHKADMAKAARWLLSAARRSGIAHRMWRSDSSTLHPPSPQCSGPCIRQRIIVARKSNFEAPHRVTELLRRPSASLLATSAVDVTALTAKSSDRRELDRSPAAELN